MIERESMEVERCGIYLRRTDGTWELDIESQRPEGSFDLECYECALVWRNKETRHFKTLATFPNWSTAIWVQFQIENFFPNGATVNQYALIRAARKIGQGYALLAEYMVVPTIRLSKAAEKHAAVLIATEGLRNFSLRLMRDGKIHVSEVIGEDNGVVDVKDGYLYVKKTYDGDGRVTDYHVRYRSI